MSFLDDYREYNSGNECPEAFVEWSGLFVLSAIAGRKLWVNHGRYAIFFNIYLCLVGEAGAGKSSARIEAKKFIRLVDPDYTVSASFQSHQDIIDTMCNMMPYSWVDSTGACGEPGKGYEFRPFSIISNELKSLLATDTKGMTDFLVDIFDENEFSTGFKTYKQNNPERKQSFDNPYVTLLACAVPKWFMGELKMDLFDGGLGRRLFIVYADKSKLVDTPVYPANYQQLQENMVKHLQTLRVNQGELIRTPEAMEFWRQWYNLPNRKNTDDPILKQFHETKHVMLLKLAGLLSLSENPLAKTIEAKHLKQALVMSDKLEKGVALLTRGIGRNELAGFGARILDYLNRTGGAAKWIDIRRVFDRELRAHECREQVEHYFETEQLIKVRNTAGQEMIILPGTPAHEQLLAKMKASGMTQVLPASAPQAESTNI